MDAVILADAVRGKTVFVSLAGGGTIDRRDAVDAAAKAQMRGVESSCFITAPCNIQMVGIAIWHGGYSGNG